MNASYPKSPMPRVLTRGRGLPIGILGRSEITHQVVEDKMIDSEGFYAALSQGKMNEAEKLVQVALETGESAETILKDGLIPAMDRVGIKFKNGEIYIPEVLIAARAMHAGMAVLKPILSKSSEVLSKKVIIGTVKGDLHDIGKNLVVMMLEGGGFEVVDLGIDVSAEKFAEAIKKHHPQVVGMSALLTTTLKEMQNILQAIERAGLRNQVKTIIGGAPVTERFAKEIGADGYAPDAASAVDVVKSLLT
jgi:5-methyltetrahydrofolate--homocysteine methyltransferase